MSRAFLIVLDSLGCGGAPDAETFGDRGANTLGHIIAARQGSLYMPNLAALGLGAALTHSWPRFALACPYRGVLGCGAGNF